MERLIYHQQDYASFWQRIMADGIDFLLIIGLGSAFDRIVGQGLLPITAYQF